MLDVYLVTLALAVAFGMSTTVVLLAASRTERFSTLFQEARGLAERPRWGGAAILLAFAATPFVASAISSQANEFFSPKSGDFLAFLGACALVFAIGFLDDLKLLAWQPKLAVQVAAASAVYSAGYQIEVARDGREAPTRLEHASYPVVITDLEMPQMNGRALCEAMRGLPSGPPSLTLVLTGRTDLEIRDWAQRMPATELIEKPVSLRRLVARLHRHLDALPVAADTPA